MPSNALKIANALTDGRLMGSFIPRANKRRMPISSCVTQQVSTDLEEAAFHHSLSISEIVSRIVSKACHEGFPTDRAKFDELYPAHHPS